MRSLFLVQPGLPDDVVLIDFLSVDQYAVRGQRFAVVGFAEGFELFDEDLDEFPVQPALLCEGPKAVVVVEHVAKESVFVEVAGQRADGLLLHLFGE